MVGHIESALLKSEVDMAVRDLLQDFDKDTFHSMSTVVTCVGGDGHLQPPSRC